MTNVSVWNTLLIVFVSVAGGLLLYIWISIALSAVFRKCGEEAWKAWVPFLNTIVFLRLAGLSPWLVLLFLVPVAGWVCQIVAAHRLNLSFGYGTGMTVLAALVFPVWATVLGFGAARWVGHEGSVRGPVRTGSADVPPPPPLPDPAQPATTTFAPVALPRGFDAPAADAGDSFTPSPAPAVRAGWAPPPAPSGDAPPARPPAPADSLAPVTAVPGAFAGSEPEDDDLDEASAPRPRRSGAPLPDPEGDRSWDADFAHGSTTGEVTDAVPGAPAPVSAAAPVAPPASATPAPPVSAAPPVPSAPPVSAAPPVTSVPASTAPSAAMREPWAPAPSPLPGEGEAFPETSGPVSAIAEAPEVGGPRSARSSVSALHTRPHIPEEDDLDETIVARRKRTAWTLIGPGGARIPLTSDVVLVGRRPAPDEEFPRAQLVALDDDTRTISKTHARLRLRDEKWYITDLASTNGVLFTTLMGTEVAATPGEETEAGESFLLGDAEVSLTRSDR